MYFVSGGCGRVRGVGGVHRALRIAGIVAVSIKILSIEKILK